MALSRLLQSNFAAGELTDRIAASGDLERYGAGLSRALNLVILALGGAERRSGSVFAVEPADPLENGRLLPFVRDIADAVAVVVNNGKLRFISATTRAYVESGGSPVELTCPWGEADLDYLFVWQSIDVLWIGDRRGTGRVKALLRVAGVWQALTDLIIENGPFLPDEEVILTLGGVTGSVSLSTPSDVFLPAHVGALIGVRENTGAPGVKRWLASEAVNSGDQRFNGGRVYSAGSTATTGTNSPIHDEGAVSDGTVTWTYLHDGLGVARITAVSGPRAATATVEARMPSTSTPYWGFSAFSDAAGWPRAATIHQERVVFGGAASSPDTIYLSRVEEYGPDYVDFKAGLGTGLVVDSDAVRRSFGTGQVQQILHFVSFERLYAFTSEAVHIVSGPSIDEPITPAAASARERCAFGAAALVAPIKTGDSVLYVTAGQEEIREIERESVDTPNVTVLADHIGGRRFAELAFARAPSPVLWTRLADGWLASMTYERLEGVRAWAQSQLGGAAFVTSLIVLPGADGRSELWMYVRRVIDGVNRYSIEIMPPPWSKYREPLEKACSLDAAAYFDFWNTNVSNRARLTVLDVESRGARIETELNSFASGDVGKRVAVRLAPPANGYDPGDDATIARVDIMSFVDAKTVEGRIVSDGAATLPGTWTVHWALMASSLSLGVRLKAQTLDVLGDGSAQRGLVANASGVVTLAEPVARAWAGLPFRFELIDLPLAQGSPLGTAFGARKRVEKLWVIAAAASAGMKVFNPETGKEDELVFRDAGDPVDRPAMPQTGKIALLPAGMWSDNGQIGLRQDNPLPATILGIVKEVSVT